MHCIIERGVFQMNVFRGDARMVERQAVDRQEAVEMQRAAAEASALQADGERIEPDPHAPLPVDKRQGDALAGARRRQPDRRQFPSPVDVPRETACPFFPLIVDLDGRIEAASVDGQPGNVEGLPDPIDIGIDRETVDFQAVRDAGEEEIEQIADLGGIGARPASLSNRFRFIGGRGGSLDPARCPGEDRS